MSTNDNTNPKPVSERLKTYRSAMTASGYARTEVVIPQEVKAAAESIAKAEGVKVMDVLSAFTEMGLRTYRAETTPLHTNSAVVPLGGVHESALQLSGALGAAPLFEASAGACGLTSSLNLLPSHADMESPIAAFIRKRKG